MFAEGAIAGVDVVVQSFAVNGFVVEEIGEGDTDGDGAIAIDAGELGLLLEEKLGEFIEGWAPCHHLVKRSRAVGEVEAIGEGLPATGEDVFLPQDDGEGDRREEQTEDEGGGDRLEHGQLKVKT